MLDARLMDPTNCAGSAARLNKLQKKISDTMARLFRKPENGGNPFLFTFTAPKPHELRTELKGLSIPFTTAATDGRKYYWNPDFLEKLTLDEVATVMQHEGYHVIFYHCKRGRGFNPRVFNWAIDYVVNGCIETDQKKTNRKGQLWGGNIGTPLPFKKLLAYIDGKQELDDNAVIFVDVSLHGRSPESIYEEIMKHWEKSPRRCQDCGALSMNPKTGKPNNTPCKQKNQNKGKQCNQKNGKCPVHGQGQKQGKGQQGQQGQGQQGQGQQQQGNQGGQGQQQGSKGQGQAQGQGQGGQQPGQCPPGGGDQGGCEHNGQCCDGCGAPPGGGGMGFGLPSGMDAHIDAEVTKQEVMADVMRAAQQTTQMRGSVPSEIEGVLGELKKPTLSFKDLVRSALLRKVLDDGMRNDWKRLRRRWLATRPRQYLPRRHTFKPRWLAMIDTSGSMGDDDIIYGISQLQSLGNESEGFVVPCDAKVHWKGVQKIDKVKDLKKTKIIGRGGTVFDDFFKEFPNELGTDFDVIIIITDGYCGQVPMELRPPCDVVWVITTPGYEYQPSFGRVAPLRNERM